ncbi:MAG: DUF3465 domain-containing protein [Methylococcaceae bacterium]
MKLIIVLMLGFIFITPSAKAEINLQQRAALISSSDWIIKQAFINKKSGLQVQDTGIVTRLLSDDLIGGRHQRFILRLTSGQTLLIAHNIDIAPRLIGLKVNDTVSFYGQYEWNSQGGLVHWTHRDPSRKHITGWLKYKGKTYQ